MHRTLPSLPESVSLELTSKGGEDWTPDVTPQVATPRAPPNWISCQGLHCLPRTTSLFVHFLYPHLLPHLLLHSSPHPPSQDELLQADGPAILLQLLPLMHPGGEAASHTAEALTLIASVPRHRLRLAVRCGCAPWRVHTSAAELDRAAMGVERYWLLAVAVNKVSAFEADLLPVLNHRLCPE